MLRSVTLFLVVSLHLRHVLPELLLIPWYQLPLETGSFLTTRVTSLNLNRMLLSITEYLPLSRKEGASQNGLRQMHIQLTDPRQPHQAESFQTVPIGESLPGSFSKTY